MIGRLVDVVLGLALFGLGFAAPVWVWWRIVRRLFPARPATTPAAEDPR